MDILFNRLILVIVVSFSFSIFSQSLSSIRSEIDEQLRPISRTLDSIDKSHLNKSSWAERRMAISSNIELQKDLYQRVMKVRDLIYTYSTKSKTPESIKSLKLLIQNHQKNLVRLLAIFFNFHQKFGGFPTMKHIRSLNIYVHVDAFIQIADLMRMKARHLSDEKIEILVKEVEYIQIASSVYTSNMDNNHLRSDYAHLVQFMATQQTVINRGQLTQLDSSSTLKEKKINRCMPNNLYLGESENFAISEHALNTEDKMTQFFGNFSSKLNVVINEIAKQNPVSEKRANSIASKILSQGHAALFFTAEVIDKEIDNFASKANDLMRSHDELTIKNLDEIAARFNVDVSVFGQLTQTQSFIKSLAFDKNEQSVEQRRSAIIDYYKAQLSSGLVQNLGGIISSMVTAKKVNAAFLNGDKVSESEFSSRARRYVERDLYKALAEFIKYISGSKSRVDMSAYASDITLIMNSWESNLVNTLDKSIKNFSLNSVKETKLKYFVEAEFYKALPYMKSLYFTRFAKKHGEEGLIDSLKSFPHRESLEFSPDSISELKSLEGGARYSDSIDILESGKFIDNLYKEISQAYGEMTPFFELMSANPNDYFYSENGFVRIDQSGLDKRVFANLDEFTQKRGYAVDNKYYPSLQAQFLELSLYAKSGDANYLSARMKRYLKSRSRNGRFSKNTAKTLISMAGNPQKLTKNSVKTNISVQELILNKDKLAKQKKSLLWNITSWKIGEYLQEMGMTQDDLKEKLNLDTRVYTDKKGQRKVFELVDERKYTGSAIDNVRVAKTSLKTPIFKKSKMNNLNKLGVNPSFKSLPSTISAYTSEIVIMTSFVEKAVPAATIPYKRDQGFLKKDSSLAVNPYAKLLSNLVISLGMRDNFLNARVAKGADAGLFKLNAFDYKKIAQTRINELYAFSSLLRTPYKLGTSGDITPTAFRLLGAYDITSNSKIKIARMKAIIKDTIFQAMRNSNEMAEKWCAAVYKRSGSNDQFNHLYRNSPLMRRELIAEVGRIESRRGNSFNVEDLQSHDSYLAKKAKSTGERIHETMEAVSMALGIIMLVALALTGIGAIGSAAIIGIGSSAFAMTMNQVIFLFFAISFGSRMHHIYFRVPATLSAQYKVASTQVIKTLYADWDELEKQIEDNRHERTSPGNIAWHIAEGAMQGAFAFHALKVPYIRYSGKHMVSILEKAGMEVHSVLKPMKPVKLYTKFKWSSVKGNWKSFRNSLENMTNKLLKRRDYILGVNTQHQSHLLGRAFKNRVIDSLGGKFDRNSLVKLKEILKREEQLLKLDRGHAIVDLDAGRKAFEGIDVHALGSIAGRTFTERLSNSFNKGIKFFKDGYSHRRAYFKALREGNLRKYKALRNKTGNNIDEFKEALDQMSLNLRAQKVAANKSMLQKIEDVLDLKNLEILDDAKVLDEITVLFGNGAGAFNQAEAMAFAGKVLTSTKIGGLATKYRLLKSMMDHGVLSQRVKTGLELYFQKYPASIVEHTFKGAQEGTKAAQEAYKAHFEMTQILLDGEKGSRVFKIPTAKQAFNRVENYFMSAKGKKRGALFLTLSVGGAMMWKEVNFYYQELKDKYSQENGKEFQGSEFIETIEQLDAIIDGDNPHNVPWSQSWLGRELDTFEELARPALELYEQMSQKTKDLENEMLGEEDQSAVNKTITLAKSVACQEREFQDCKPDSIFVKSQQEQLDSIKSEAESLNFKGLVEESDNLSERFSRAN